MVKLRPGQKGKRKQSFPYRQDFHPNFPALFQRRCCTSAEFWTFGNHFFCCFLGFFFCIWSPLGCRVLLFSSGSLENWQPGSFKAGRICLVSSSSIQRQSQSWHLAAGLDARAIPHHIQGSSCQKPHGPKTFFSMENSSFWRDQRLEDDGAKPSKLWRST